MGAATGKAFVLGKTLFAPILRPSCLLRNGAGVWQ
jgi:hypothetical protein